MTTHPIGSGPFKFVSAETDKEVILERNRQLLGRESQTGSRSFCRGSRCHHSALELRKGSGDATINALTPDTVLTLSARSVSRRRTRSRYRPQHTWDSTCAIRSCKMFACARPLPTPFDRRPMIEYLWRGRAQPARSILPPQSWAYNGNVPAYDHDPEKARAVARCRRLSRQSTEFAFTSP